MSFYTPFAFVKQEIAGYDPDAQAFIDATGISGTNADAINTLVLDLKAANVWTKLQAAYPMVGGTSTTHKYNLVDPQDTDAAFRLTFTGGVTHDSNGVTFNGSTGWANTYFTPSTNFASINSAHISVYNRTSGLTSGFFLATRMTGTNTTAIQFDPTRVDYSAVNSAENSAGTYTTLQGFILATRSVFNTETHYLNGTSVFTPARNTTALPGNALTLGGRNANTPASPQAGTFTAFNCAFATIGTGLTGTEEGDLYTAIQDYQTTLGRQV